MTFINKYLILVMVSFDFFIALVYNGYILLNDNIDNYNFRQNWQYYYIMIMHEDNHNFFLSEPM